MTHRPCVVAAPDKFRGSATARDVAGAIAAGAASLDWSCVEVPLADGGEGTLEALGGANRRLVVTGPLGQPVEASWRLDESGTAVVEMAQASGLDVVGGKTGNDPVAATTRGTGELIAAAVDAGAHKVVIGVGGSATSDGGQGAVEVLDRYGRFGTAGAPELLVACDVRTRFVDAARRFGPQKGAGDEQIELLTDRLAMLQGKYLSRYGVDVSNLPGAGAAGGLAGGLAALGARLMPGFELISGQLRLDAALATADAVITGEGLLDEQSFNGKVVGGVVEAARRLGVPAFVIVGAVDDGYDGEHAVVSIAGEFGFERSWTKTLDCIRQVVPACLGSLALTQRHVRPERAPRHR